MRADQTEAAAVKVVSDADGQAGFWRYSGRNMTQNASAVTGVSSTAFYWSVANPSVTEFRGLLGLGDDSSYDYSDYGSSAALNSLAAVRYYTMNHGNLVPPPYGFVHVKDVNVQEPFTESMLDQLREELDVGELTESQSSRIYNATASHYAIYENEYALPLAYTYKTSISTDLWNTFNAVEKREALLQSIVLEDAEEGGGTEPELTAQSLDYQIVCDSEEVTCQGNTVVATSDEAHITLLFEGIENSETYLVVDGFEMKATSAYDLYFGNQTVDPLNLYTQTQWKLLSANKRKSIIKEHFLEEKPDRFSIMAKADNGMSVTLKYCTPYHSFYCGRHDFAFHFGYGEQPVNAIDITLPCAGVYSFDKVGIFCQPMDQYPAKIEALKEDTLEHVEIGSNTVTGDISLDTDKWLCFAIPYSSGWHAYVDGEKAELRRANIQYMALRLPAGEHKVQLIYETPLLKTGLWISAISLILLLLVMGAVHKRGGKLLIG